MKKIIFITIALLVAIVLQGQDYKGQTHVISHSLIEQNDTLFVSLEILVKGNALRRHQSLFIVPELSAGNDIKQLPFVIINGTNQQRMLQRWKTLSANNLSHREPLVVFHASDRDTVINYEVSEPYKLWMDSALLHINYELRTGNRPQRLYAVTMGHQVEPKMHKPFIPQPIPNFIEPPREEKTRNIQGQAFLDFQLGRSEIKPDFRRNPEELASIRNIMKTVTTNDDITEISRIFIEGYASPDGPYALNERLARERAEALKNYIKSNFNLPEKLFRVSSSSEDWYGFEVIMLKSTMPYRDEILAIINSGEDFDKKESMLRALGGGAPFRRLLDEVFPKLRRSEIRIDFTVRDYNYEEARSKLLKRQNTEWLSQAELFSVAQSYHRRSREFAEIIELARRQNPDDNVANINSAAVMIERGEQNTARRYLETAAEDPRAYNNLGIIYLLEGNIDRAEELFKKALADGVEEATHNLRETQNKREDNIRMQRFR